MAWIQWLLVLGGLYLALTSAVFWAFCLLVLGAGFWLVPGFRLVICMGLFGGVLVFLAANPGL